MEDINEFVMTPLIPKSLLITAKPLSPSSTTKAQSKHLYLSLKSQGRYHNPGNNLDFSINI